MWIAGLKALVPAGQGGRSKIDGWSDGGLYFEVNLIPEASFQVPLGHIFVFYVYLVHEHAFLRY